MSEWIKRSEQKPPKGVVVVHTDGENFWTVRDIGHNAWTHWISIPAPPPRTVMIELSEDDARGMADRLGYGPNAWESGLLVSVAEACRKALEGKR